MTRKQRLLFLTLLLLATTIDGNGSYQEKAIQAQPPIKRETCFGDKKKFIYKDYLKTEIQKANERQMKLKAEELAKIEHERKVQAQEQQKQQKQQKSFKIELSFYTNSFRDCDRNDGLSASGKYLRESYVYCAAPADIAFGTKIAVDNFGTLTVADRGGAIHYKYNKDGNKIMKLDVFIYNASSRFIANKGIINTTGYIIK